MSRTYGKAQDLIDFTRTSSGTALRRVKYGAELVTNGTFDSSDNWVLGANWTVSGGVATLVGGDGVYGNSALYQLMDLEVGKIYQVSLEVSSLTGGVRIYNATYGAGTTIDREGTIVIPLVGESGGTRLNIFGNSGSAVTIDNVSVKEVTFDTSDGDLILFNHPNNIPRIEYDANGNLLGLLVEESRTNLIPYSDFSSGWDKSSLTVTANFISSPDGQTNGAEVDLLTTGGFFYDTISVTAGTVYTWSWYAKAGTATAWILAVYDETNAAFVTRQQYTLTDGESVGDGWYRHSYTFTAPAGCSSARVYPIRGLDASGGIAGTVGTTYLYNAQVEAGSFATSAIPTSGSTATRSADVASIGTNAFGWNGSEGTLFVQYERQYAEPTGGSFPKVFHVDDGTGNNRFFVQGVPSNTNMTIATYNSGSSTSLSPAATFAASNKIAISIDSEASFKFVINGSVSGSLDTNIVDLSLLTSVSIGLNLLGPSQQVNGHIKALKYIPRELTDSQLEALTA